jgi:hypothetical protein
MWPDILEILKYTIPAFIVLLATYIIVRNFMKSEYKKLEMKLRRETAKETLLLRLQAYERLMIFLERISPPNLFVRFDKEGLSAKEFQKILVASIRAEYEHNLSQQIYVSSKAWRLTSLAKDETIKVINLMANAIPPGSSAMDLSRDILKFYLESEQQFPGEEAMLVIKEEVKQLL